MAILKNARHEKFAIGLADGLSQEKAYIGAGFSPNGARGSASTLIRQFPHIIKRRNEILAEREELHAISTVKACEALAMDKTYVINELIDNAKKAKTGDPILNRDGEIVGYKKNISASNQALMLLGKELGMFNGCKELEQVEPYRDVEELKERIRRRSLKLGAAVLGFPGDDGTCN
jgi:hypothetical protein